MAYLLDANVLISAARNHYGFAFCPAFWTWLEVANASGLVYSIDKVRDELLAKNDDVAKWAREKDGDFFLKSTAKLSQSQTVVGDWVSQGPHSSVAKMKFINRADFELIVHAHADNHTVVTHEGYVNSVKKVKIPIVCNGLGIEVMTPFEMLCNEKPRFVLEKR